MMHPMADVNKRALHNPSIRHAGEGDCVAIGENSFKIVIPAKAGIQKLLKLLDSPVSSTGQAQSRASLARNDKKVIMTQSPTPE